MLHDILSRSNRGNYHIVREDQIRYAFEKPTKSRPRIRIKFGHEVAEKANIHDGNGLKVQWDDESKQIIITKSADGFVLHHPPNQKPFILFYIPPRIKIPLISKTFTNFTISQEQIVLDFRFEDLNK